MKRIAVLGWGSLVWDPDPLQLEEDPRASDIWKREGPELPIEFSRISGRDRLTLVIDSDNGRQIPTRWALSRLVLLDEARENLRQREKTPRVENIGYLEAESGNHGKGAEDTIKSIWEWVENRQLDAVIWTALGSNFEKKRGRPFSVEAALEYLESLEENGDPIPAAEYIIRAPAEVQTPSRPSLQEWAERIIAERSPAHQ